MELHALQVASSARYDISTVKCEH